MKDRRQPLLILICIIALFMMACSANEQSNQGKSEDNPTPQVEHTPQVEGTLQPPITLESTETSKPSQASEVQIRIVNISDLDFDNVLVNFLGQEVDYGGVASSQQSDYQTAKEAYHYAWVKVDANGQTYKFTPIDYVGETLLSPGRYSYVLDIVDEALEIAYAPDDEPVVDVDLVDIDWYWASAQLLDNSHLFPMIHEEHPSIRFTSDPDPNVPGLHFEGYASCNWIGGPYHVNQYHTLMIDEIEMTERGCADSERFFLDFFRGINYYSIEGDYLLLFSRTGEIMTFTHHDPASEPPYATNSYAALAPIVQAIASHARELNVTRLTPSSDVLWMIDFFGEQVNVYVFDDVVTAEERAKSSFSSDNSERLWQDERFLIRYDGDYDLVDDVLNELFGEPFTVDSQLSEEARRGGRYASIRA